MVVIITLEEQSKRNTTGSDKVAVGSKACTVHLNIPALRAGGNYGEQMAMLGILEAAFQY